MKGIKGQHKNYAEKGTVAGIGSTPKFDSKEFASGGFVSTNDEAHKRCGAPLHYGKTPKVKTRQP